MKWPSMKHRLPFLLFALVLLVGCENRVNVEVVGLPSCTFKAGKGPNRLKQPIQLKLVQGEMRDIQHYVSFGVDRDITEIDRRDRTVRTAIQGKAKLTIGRCPEQLVRPEKRGAVTCTAPEVIQERDIEVSAEEEQKVTLKEPIAGGCIY